MPSNNFEQYILQHAPQVGRDVIKAFSHHKVTSSHFSFGNDYSFSAFQSDLMSYFNGAFWQNNSKDLQNLFFTLLYRYQITPSANQRQKYHCSRTTAYDSQIHDSPGSLAFISQTSTEHLIAQAILCHAEAQSLDTPQRLYQYLSWTFRINKIGHNIHCFTLSKPQTPIDFIIIHTDLHNQAHDNLYALCVRNDKQTKSMSWQLAGLLTVQTLLSFIPKSQLHLPQSIRKKGNAFSHFAKARPQMTKPAILALCKANAYQQLKNIETRFEKNKPGLKTKLIIGLTEFTKAVQFALASQRAHHQLIPIVSILSRKKKNGPNGNYSVDLVLPVQIREHWVGVVYRMMEKVVRPVMLLFDRYDITNKAILFSPRFKKHSLDWFQNNISKIVIKNNDFQSQSQNQNQHQLPSPIPSCSPISSPLITKPTQTQTQIPPNPTFMLQSYPSLSSLPSSSPSVPPCFPIPPPPMPIPIHPTTLTNLNICVNNLNKNSLSHQTQSKSQSYNSQSQSPETPELFLHSCQSQSQSPTIIPSLSYSPTNPLSPIQLNALLSPPSHSHNHQNNNNFNNLPFNLNTFPVPHIPAILPSIPTLTQFPNLSSPLTQLLQFNINNNLNTTPPTPSFPAPLHPLNISFPSLPTGFPQINLQTMPSVPPPPPQTFYLPNMNPIVNNGNMNPMPYTFIPCNPNNQIQKN